MKKFAFFLCIGMVFGVYAARADLADGVQAAAHSLIPPVLYSGGAPQVGPLDCFRDIQLGGNAQFTLNIGSPPLPWCHLNITNVDVYTGPGSGRGKLISATGITNFWLYPGMQLSLSANGNSWSAGQPLNSQYGLLWFAPQTVTFFTDTGGSDTANDGLASGASGAFQTIAKCVTAAYNQVYVRQSSGVNCTNTASQTQSPAGIIQLDYPLPNGGTLQFKSTSTGTAWTWDCPVAAGCLQIGDGFLGGITDVTFSGSSTSPYLISGHNYAVLDFNTDVTLISADAGGQDVSCDYDTHFNFNNGVTLQGNVEYFFYGCQGSSWQFNSAINGTSSPTATRFVAFQSGSKGVFQGNVTFGTFGTMSAGIATGNSVLNNLSGLTPPGGAFTIATGGQACTSLC